MCVVVVVVVVGWGDGGLSQLFALNPTVATPDVPLANGSLIVDVGHLYQAPPRAPAGSRPGWAGRRKGGKVVAVLRGWGAGCAEAEALAIRTCHTPAARARANTQERARAHARTRARTHVHTQDG